MTIGIDIREAREGGAGKGRYTFELVQAMLMVPDENTYILFDNRKQSPFGNSDRVRYVHIEGSGLLWHLNLWHYIRKHPPDWVLSPTSFIYAALSPKKQKVAIIIHDLIAFLYADNHPRFPTLVERLTLSRAIRKAQVIDCISEHTKADLRALFPDAKSKVVTIPPAVSSSLSQTEQRTMDVPSNFILSVGTVLPRKNIALLLRVMERLHTTHPELSLCIAGQTPGTDHPVMKTLPPEMRQKIHFLGHVTDGQLRELYSRASVFAFPSLYEGFGIPPLEAMACGCPVIASNRSSLPEAVGDGGILVDPDDLEAWVQGINRLLQPETINQYRERGYAWIKRFSWESSAITLLDALRNKS